MTAEIADAPAEDAEDACYTEHPEDTELLHLEHACHGPSTL